MMVNVDCMPVSFPFFLLIRSFAFAFSPFLLSRLTVPQLFFDFLLVPLWLCLIFVAPDDGTYHARCKFGPSLTWTEERQLGSLGNFSHPFTAFHFSSPPSRFLLPMYVHSVSLFVVLFPEDWILEMQFRGFAVETDLIVEQIKLFVERSGNKLKVAPCSDASSLC